MKSFIAISILLIYISPYLRIAAKAAEAEKAIPMPLISLYRALSERRISLRERKRDIVEVSVV